CPSLRSHPHLCKCRRLSSRERSRRLGTSRAGPTSLSLAPDPRLRPCNRRRPCHPASASSLLPPSLVRRLLRLRGPPRLLSTSRFPACRWKKKPSGTRLHHALGRSI